MTSLSEAWTTICTRKADLSDLPPARWSEPWSTHPASASRIYQAAAWRQPRLIVETGTFEGLGTFALAKAAQSYGGARIYTVDYDGDPDAEVEAEKWAELKRFRDENLAAARSAFPDVDIVFVEGDSRIVLPELAAGPARGWEMFFQDSMHFTSGIQAEWNIMEPACASRALVVFDDVCLDWRKLPSHLTSRPDFCLWFVLHRWHSWSWRSTGEGRGQFFAQRR
jgi:predicted O-methyltransferase YrrM